MAIFTYVGRDSNSKKIKGVVDAENVNAAIEFIQKQNIIPLHVEPENRRLSALLSLIHQDIRLFSKIVPIQELLSFCRGMSALEEVGIPIVDAIRQFSTSTSSKVFAKILNEIADSIVAGNTLANTLSNYPHIFSPLFTSIIEVGENTGNLSQIFLKLADYIEMAQNNRRRLITAVQYPITVIVITMVAIMLVNAVVIPKFAAIFSKMKGTLPLPTRMIMGLSSFVSNNWLEVLVIIAVVIFTIIYLLKIPVVRLFWDKHKLSLPIFGSLQKRILLLQFTWIFCLILRSGLPIIKGLALAAGATGNAYFKSQTLLICENLERGETFTNASIMSNIFPSSVLQLIGAGERSGRLDDVLSTVTDYYEREIDYDIKSMNGVIEPILLSIVGLMVLLFALGVYLPMWNLVELQAM